MQLKVKHIISAICGILLCIIADSQNSVNFGELPSSEPFIGSSKLPVGLFVGTNISPILNGEYSLELEYYRTIHIDYHLSFGFAENPKRGSYLKIESEGFHDIGYGGFVRLGCDYNIFDKSGVIRGPLRTNNPFIGGRVIASRIIEINQVESLNSPVSNTLQEEILSTNISAALTLGTSINLSKRLSVKIGAQFGFEIINNRIHDYGYSPGLGMDWKILRSQLISVVRYRLINSSKSVSMRFSR